MLYFLIGIMMVFMGNIDCASAQGTFFEEKVDFFPFAPESHAEENEGSCFSCGATPSLGGDQAVQSVNTRYLETRKYVMNKITSHKEKQSVYLFLTPECSYSERAIESLLSFQEKYPGWDIKLLFNGEFEKLKEFIRQKGVVYADKVSFLYDIDGKYFSQYAVQEVPTFVIIKGDKVVKGSGQIDLERIVHEM